MPRVKKLFVIEKKKKNNNNQLIMLYQSLIKSKASYIDKFMKIIVQNKLKIIIIEYFITNYSKKYQIIIKKSNNDFFYINDEYKNQLKSFNKKFFDPYKRNNKFELEHNKQIIITTVGQMNFFKWAIENQIINYIEEHYKEIVEDYSKSK
jgi:hypothetical protein|tara:strand:+ start:2303 stop:2752 length:450 start_codon:yes stop_codon:yes gene_type:complete